MAFVKKDWKDRIAEFINRRRLTYEDGRTELVEVARDEGTVSQEGDAFIAETMNDLEERIEKALTPLDTMKEIEANTQDDQLAGANAVKELSEIAHSFVTPLYDFQIKVADHTSDVFEALYTCTEDGYIFAKVRTQSVSGTPFIRLSINDLTLFEGNGLTGTYKYLWSPCYPVKKGDVVKYTLQDNVNSDQTNRQLVFSARR